LLSLLFLSLIMLLSGEFGIVYKGCLAGQCVDEVVAIKTLKGDIMITYPL
jgi:hypothetical protein